MIRRFALVVAALALLAPLASAQTLDDVLSKHFAAMGGLDKLRALQSIRMTGTMAMGPGMEAPFTLEKKRPNQMRLEFTVQGMTGIQAYDGKVGWMSMPFMGKKDAEVMPAEALKEVEDQADFDGALVDWKAKGHTVELMGKEDVEGTSAYKLKVTHKNGNVDYEFIDAETFLVMKTEAKRSVRGTEVETESSLGDYKPVEGLVFPYAMEMGAKGSSQTQKMTFSKIELNPTLDASRFVMPPKPDSTAAAKPDSAAKASSAKAGAKAVPDTTKKAPEKKSGK